MTWSSAWHERFQWQKRKARPRQGLFCLDFGSTSIGQDWMKGFAEFLEDEKVIRIAATQWAGLFDVRTREDLALLWDALMLTIEDHPNFSVMILR